ncbi:hypothetical protein BDQ17DRAFT_1434647 [Cyathus striatus]|nr:hypothetical protein BDQ17DRAFT_1434647 [Cyathus striatus]
MSHTFKPIPSHMVSHIGGWNRYPSTYYFLWKDGHQLVVEVPCIPKHDISYYMENPQARAKVNNQYDRFIEMIQAVIDTVEFGKTNWAYLTSGAKGGYKLQLRKKPLPAITCPLWAPVIRECEVKIKKFVDGSYRIGEWKGQEVDIYRAFDNFTFKYLNRMMENYRILEGTDLTFQVQGHLLDDAGTVVGLVTEPMTGREVKVSDRSLVYKVVADLQRRGFLLMAISHQFIFISQGKVRFACMGNEVVRYYPPDKTEELVKLAAQYHWEDLRYLFSEGITTGWPTFRQLPARLNVFPKIPSPERPYQVPICLVFQLSYFIKRQDKDKVVVEKRSITVSIAPERPNHALSDGVKDIEGQRNRKNGSKALIRTRHHASQHKFIPYLPSSTRRAIAYKNDETEATSDSIS